jgi:hypothetical protein
MNEVLHPGEVGVAARGQAELPARVVVFAEPVGVVEGRVGQDVVGAEIGMEIAPEGVGLLFAEIGFDAPWMARFIMARRRVVALLS